MSELYSHQLEGVRWLAERKSAMLCDEMGLGKTRQALIAAFRLYRERKIDRILVLAPAAVRYSWQEEVQKIGQDGQHLLIWCRYYPKDCKIVGQGFAEHINALPICVLSYALLPQKRHVEALKKWCEDGKTLLVCDESSFLKNRTAKQTKGAAALARAARYRWLLTGTPVANSPLDLFGQSLVMANGGPGPLSQFKNFYHFRSRYAVLKMMNMGQVRFQQVVGYQNLEELTKRFAPYVLRRTKAECLDLPAKSYTVREIALTEATWRIYQELRKEALLALPDEDVRPEPNAAVRILRLQQLTSGHVGFAAGFNPALNKIDDTDKVFESIPGIDSLYEKQRDVSSEKLDWLCSALLDGELSNEQAVIVWTRWRRERERLHQLLATKIEVYGIFGGQQDKNRSFNVQSFQTSTKRRVLIAQVHAGGFGLNLTAASTAVYLSNSFSFTDRIQSEDRCHRIGQKNVVTYVDVMATGPRGQRTVDAHVLDCLRAKKNIAEMTTREWRRVLEE
jgi:SNF2 family DNA or RNA helicase